MTGKLGAASLVLMLGLAACGSGSTAPRSTASQIAANAQAWLDSSGYSGAQIVQVQCMQEGTNGERANDQELQRVVQLAKMLERLRGGRLPGHPSVDIRFQRSEQPGLQLRQLYLVRLASSLGTPSSDALGRDRACF